MAKKKIILGFGFLLILAILILIASVKANATDYYFDATLGNDANSGTQASPKRTITGAGGFNSIFASLSPGDRIFFKRGETFTGTLNISRSGSSGSPITIGNYGSGNLPVITGLITITGWGTVTGGVAESASFTALPSKLQVVLINGVLYSIGRWPDQTNWKVGVYRPINSFADDANGYNISITDNTLPSTPNYTGATAVIHSSRWTVDAARITSITNSGRTLNLDYDNPDGMSYSLCSGTDCNGYFIQNHASTLTKFGEWYHNPSTDKIKIYFGATNPTSVTVQAATVANLLTASSRSYITVDGIHFKGANENAINISGGQNFIIQNCEISYTGRDGISASGSNHLIDNNDIIYSYNDGIRMNSATNVDITNNFINYSFFAAGMGVSGNSYGNGIWNGINSVCQYNTVLNSGFIGIRVGKSPNVGNMSEVYNNFIDTCLFVNDDGGGIYDFVGHSTTQPEFINRDQRITGNIILGMVGASEGVKGSTSYKPAAGIYMDDNSNGFTISGNAIANSPGFGLFLHNATNGAVTGNTLYNNGATTNFSNLMYKHDGLGWAVKDIVTTGNVLFSKSSSQFTAQYISTTMANMTWNNNYYAKPISESSSHIKFNANNYTFSGWKSASGGKDANSYGYGATMTWPTPITGSTVTRFEYNELKVNKVVSLDGIYKDIQGNTYTCSITLSPFASKVLIKTGTGCAGNLPPTVSVTAPANNTSYFAPASVTMNATASDPDGTVTSVGFYNNGVLVGSDNTSPYTFSFSIANAGTYKLTARATDNGGLVTTSSEITVTVNDVSSVFPTVSMTSPANNATATAPASFTLSADAADADGTITKVEFFHSGSTLINTEFNAPYSVTWSNVPIGSYSLTAKATDNSGNVTTSTAIAVTVTNALPVVNIVSPQNNSSFLPSAIINFDATATDANGSIVSVKFYDGATLFQTETNPPYQFTRGGFTVGNHTITAVATDNNLAVSTSPPITFTISGSNPTPTVAITAPADGATVTSHTNVIINATATDDGSVASVSFYVNDVLLNTDNAAPYTFTWNDVSIGSKTITAIATDNLNAIGTSSAVVITVQNIAPTVSITSPAMDASFVAPASIEIEATASDANGSVSQVAFYNGGVLIGTDVASPFTFTWTGVPTGSYNLTAIATDNDGGMDTSDVITVTSTNTAPEISLTANVVSANPWNVDLVATATDINGNIVSVDFYEGTTLIATEIESPYEYTVIPTGAGEYSWTAIVMDSDSATATSNTVTLTLAAPTVSITSVTVTDDITPGIIDIAATATDNVSVAQVDFYANDVLIGTDLTSPYTFSWTNVTDGVYIIHAVATDNDGATTTTPNEAPVQILAGSISITNTEQVYDGSPKPVTVTTTAESFTVTYDGSATVPTNAGTYEVVATITSGGGGSDTKTLVISKADAGLVWEEPEAITYLDELTATELDATADVAGTFDYTPALGTVLGGGVRTLTVIFTPTDLTNYNIDTAIVNLIVNKAVAVLAITSQSTHAYDGQAKVATATVTPNVGVITITYNGSLTPPKEVGIYTIAVTLQDDNYAAELVSGTLEITPIAVPSPTETRNFLLLNRTKIVNQ